MTERGKQSLESTELKEITTVVDSGRGHSSLAVIGFLPPTLSGL
jgi:hypothetical protein